MNPASWVRRLFALLLLGTLGARGLAAEGDRPPECVKQVAPEYPFSLRLSGNKGTVIVRFVVDPQGDVIKASVQESSHPDFEAPAVEAVLRWKFRPALKAGQPVYVQMQVPILFNIEQMALGSTWHSDPLGVDVWKIAPHASKGVPPEFDYDSPPRPVLTSAPVYPYESLVKKARGLARVDFAVDPRGFPHVVRLEEVSAPEFGAAAAAMILAWKFAPATQGGKPCWAYLSKEVRFDRDNREFPLSDSAERLLKDLGRVPCPILTSAGDLDAPLQGRFQPGPVVPDALMKPGGGARAVVEFIVDHAGHAQLPRVVSATDPDFGWAAATAVARWQFTQPLSHGHPVDVRASIPLVYSSPAAAKGT